MNWTTEGFENFREGEFGNGGHNIYVSQNGVLQRIHRFDSNQNGYIDLLFVNSQDFNERPPLDVYDANLAEAYQLPTQGAFAAVAADLNSDGFDDLIIANQCGGHVSDVPAYIYFGSEKGFSEKYRIDLPAPDSLDVAVGDFNGNGKKDIAFASAGRIRVFHQDDRGFAEGAFHDIEVPATHLAAGDLTGNGCDDLYVRVRGEAPMVLLGGENGLRPEHSVTVGGDDIRWKVGASSTPGWREYEEGWRPKIISIGGKKYLFRPEKNGAVFYAFNGESAEIAFVFPCANPVSVATGDIFGSGEEDVVVAVSDQNRSKTVKSLIFKNIAKGVDPNPIEFETRNVRDILLCDLNGDGCLDILVCQGRTEEDNSCDSLVYHTTPAGIASEPIKIETHDAVAALCCSKAKSEKKQIVFVNHVTGNYLGNMPTYLYLGGPDGYSTERRREFYGWSPPTALMVDFHDTGCADLLLVNCSENALDADPGSFIFKGSGENGISSEVFETLKSTRPHGAAVGDFRHSGYLDVAFAGINTPVLTIFHGGPEEYDENRVQKISLDPDLDPETFVPIKKNGVEPDDPGAKWKQPRYMITADLNNDGWLDLILPLCGSNESLVLWGGPEGFTRKNSTTFQVEDGVSAQVADLTGNGWPDLIFGSYSTISKNTPFDSSVTIYWGGPEGFSEFRKTTLPSHSSSHMCVADFNNDGNLDIYTNSYKNSRVRDLDGYIYWNGGDGEFSIENRKRIFGHSGSGCMAADLNGNGYKDLVVAHHKTYGNHKGTSKIWWNGPEGFSEERTTKLPTLGPHGMYGVDVGDIMNRSDEEFYISKPFETEKRPQEIMIEWEAKIQMKTWVKAMIRSANTQERLEKSPWLGPDGSENSFFENGSRTNENFPPGKWIQYKLILGAENCGNSPRVTKVMLHY
jgi:hypothetical protein